MVFKDQENLIFAIILKIKNVYVYIDIDTNDNSY